jgi:hypothetical protein
VVAEISRSLPIDWARELPPQEGEIHTSTVAGRMILTKPARCTRELSSGVVPTGRPSEQSAVTPPPPSRGRRAQTRSLAKERTREQELGLKQDAAQARQEAVGNEGTAAGCAASRASRAAQPLQVLNPLFSHSNGSAHTSSILTGTESLEITFR